METANTMVAPQTHAVWLNLKDPVSTQTCKMFFTILEFEQEKEHAAMTGQMKTIELKLDLGPFFQFVVIHTAVKIVELVERFVKLVAGMINHLRKELSHQQDEINFTAPGTTTEDPAVTTFVASSDFLGEQPLSWFSPKTLCLCLNCQVVQS